MKQLLVMMCVMLLATGYVRAGKDDERVAASRATVKEFMQSLKQELQKARDTIFQMAKMAEMEDWYYQRTWKPVSATLLPSL